MSGSMYAAMISREFSTLMEKIELERIGSAERITMSKGLYRLLGVDLQSGQDTGRILDLYDQNKRDVVVICGISFVSCCFTVTFLLLFVFYLMTFVALSHAINNDRFNQECGMQMWNSVLAGALCRLLIFWFPLIPYSKSIKTNFTSPCHLFIRLIFFVSSIILCYFESESIHTALSKSGCVQLMKDSSFGTPFLAEIGIVGLTIDCFTASALVFQVISLFWGYCFPKHVFVCYDRCICCEELPDH
jgi:hypothetical protein